MWSEPWEGDGFKEKSSKNGYFFGQHQVNIFLHTNDLQNIARAHTVTMEGYALTHNEQVVTIWSAPNYGDQANQGAMMELDEDMKYSFLQFDPAPKPEKKRFLL